MNLYISKLSRLYRFIKRTSPTSNNPTLFHVLNTFAGMPGAKSGFPCNGVNFDGEERSVYTELALCYIF
ncbi:hypothetical protein FKM82_018861 [Ascaphus truei]